MLQRLLTSSSGDKSKAKEETVEPCEAMDPEQPHNPYTEILVLEHHSDIVRILARIDDKKFVSAGDDSKAVIWEVQYGKRIATLLGHSHPITCLLVEPSGEGVPLIVTGSSDRQIRIWSSDNGVCLEVLTQHQASVRSMYSVSPGIFCAGGDNLSLWSIQGSLLCSCSNSAPEDIDLVISIKQDKIITAADKDLYAYKIRQEGQPETYDLRKLKQLQSHREAINSLVTVSSSCFASGSVDGMIVLWTASNLQPTRRLHTVEDYEGDNRRFPYSVQALMCVQERYLCAAIGCSFCVWEVMSGGQESLVVQKKSAHVSKITCMGFASEGEVLVTCSEDKTLRLWGKKPMSDSWAHGGVAVTAMERFTGLGHQELHHQAIARPWEPCLLGECSAHGGTVQGFLDLDHEGLVTCGADGIVIVWKNAEMQKVRRNQAVRKLLMNDER